MNAKQKAADISHQLNDLGQEEQLQVHEQNIAQCLIKEAFIRLSSAVKTNNTNIAKVVQVLLDNGNIKLNEAIKKLEAIKSNKEQLQAACNCINSFCSQLHETTSYKPDDPQD